jgi:hypothetical protein
MKYKHDHELSVMRKQSSSIYLFVAYLMMLLHSSDYIVSNDRLNNELEGKWKQAVMAEFMVPFWHLPVGTEENHQKPSGLLVSRLIFEPGTS